MVRLIKEKAPEVCNDTFGLSIWWSLNMLRGKFNKEYRSQKIEYRIFFILTSVFWILIYKTKGDSPNFEK